MIIIFIYIYLINIKRKFKVVVFGQKIKAINECKNEEKYALLNLELQDKLFYELQSLKR